MTPSTSRRSTVSTIAKPPSRGPPSVYAHPSLRRLPPRLHNQSLRIRRSSRPSMAGSQPATSCKATSTTFATSSSTRFDSDSRSTTDTAATVSGATTRPSHQGSKRRWSSSTKRRLAGAVLPMDRSNADDMRALRALAWANHKNNWAEVPDGERLQRLTETAIDRWATRVGGTHAPAAAPQRRHRTGSARRSAAQHCTSARNRRRVQVGHQPAGSEPSSPRSLHGQISIREPASGPSTASWWTVPAAATA